MKDYEAGVTAPPFHVWCRSTTVPYFGDEFDRNGMRAARGADGKTYYVPESMTYKEWQKTFVEGGSNDTLQTITPSDTIKKKENIPELTKLKNSGMTEDDYGEYLDMINNHQNPSITQIYSKYADKISGVKFIASKGGAYNPNSNSLTFNFEKHNNYSGINKYDTLAHEYGHFFDTEVFFDGIHFKEMEAVRKATGLSVQFKSVASSSDEFLEAIRKDKEHLKNICTPFIKDELVKNNASHGVQDAIDGLFPNSRLNWGHGEDYYNKKYNDVAWMDKRLRKSTGKKALQQVYKDLGFDASNQAKVKTICRQYTAASEMWANIMSAEVNGGQDLEFVKKYLPNSYQTMMAILKGVK